MMKLKPADCRSFSCPVCRYTYLEQEQTQHALESQDQEFVFVLNDLNCLCSLLMSDAAAGKDKSRFEDSFLRPLTREYGHSLGFLHRRALVGLPVCMR